MTQLAQQGEALPCSKEVGLLVGLAQVRVLLEGQVEAAAESESVLEDWASLQLVWVAAPAILQSRFE